MLYQNMPVYLSEGQGWNPAQVSQINLLVKSLRNRFIAKAQQPQKDRPLTKKVAISHWPRVLNIRDFLYSDRFSIQFILDPKNMVKNGTYKLIETEFAPKNMVYEGSNSDSVPADFFSSLGQITYEKYLDHYVLVFKRNDREWPVDFDNNKVKYSVYIGGQL